MNNLEIYKNINLPNDLGSQLALSNYLITLDKVLKEKTLIFRLRNNTNQTLTYLEFEIVEFDNDGKLLKTSSYESKEFIIDNNKLINLNQRFKLENNTNNIKIKFNGVKFNNSTSVYEEEVKISNESLELSEVQVKIKKFPFIVPIFLVLLATLLVFLNIGMFQKGLDTKVSNFEYKIVSNQIYITGYKDFNQDIVIPETIEGKLVTKIEKDAFSYTSVKTIIILAEKISIEDNAFYNAKQLTEVSGNDISRIGHKAFYNNTNLKRLTFRNVSVVYGFAFYNTKRLKNLSFRNINDVKFTEDALEGTLFKRLYDKSITKDQSSNAWFKKEDLNII